MATRKIPKQRGEAITVTVEGFKSISKRTTLKLKPLTVLSGANSSGKSSFMQPLLLLKQTLEAQYDPGPLMINGPHIKFTTAKQLLSDCKDTDNQNHFSIALNTDSLGVELKFSRKNSKPIEITSQIIASAGKQLVLEPNKEFKPPFKDLSGELSDILKAFRSHANETTIWTERDRCFLTFGIRYPNRKNSYPLPVAGYLYGNFPSILRSMIHLPGLRGNPERTYPLSSVGKNFPGPFQNYAASIINSWQENEEEPLQTLNQYLQELDLATDISTRKIDETQVEILLGRSSNEGKAPVSIADVGMAVSQVLPVLVALAVAEAGQLVFIEQPELHLHPRAQFRLAKIICGAIERGITLVVETHSSLLLLGIQTYIAEGVIDSHDVALHWFSKNDKGVTHVDTAQLDKVGSFGDWPEDFADVSLEAEHVYLSAAENAAFGTRKDA